MLDTTWNRRSTKSPSSREGNGIEVQAEGAGPWAFGAEDDRAWIGSEIRTAVKAVLEEILEAELSAHLGAARSERTGSRHGYRNGSYGRRLGTRVGEIELRVPRERAGAFRPGVFERYRRMESPLEEALWRAYVEGVSTRRVADIVHALAGPGHERGGGEPVERAALGEAARGCGSGGSDRSPGRMATSTWTAPARACAVGVGRASG